MRATENELDLPTEFDVYVIGRELGRGVTGRVYAAEDTVLARTVAIKLITKLDVGTRQRFIEEGRAVAKLDHPNVVKIYGSGALDDRRPYFVTELVSGVSLSKVDKPMPWRGALDIAIGVARGLAAVHRCNVVHCDLKPSNIMIEGDGGPKIIDFGLARVVSDGERVVHAPVGTPEYMAPEVWCNEAPSRRSDVYSLGAVLFELLAGAPPFGNVETAQLRTHVPFTDPPALRDRAPDVDPAFAEVVAHCLRREPSARFADGDELREALERLQGWRRYTVRTDENPYRRLLPFDASHRGLFFGRRSEIDAVVGRLRSEPVVMVTGDSGVGKSSLCRAGVIPAVLDGQFGERWQALSIIPGQRPLTALASALGVPELAETLRETPALLVRELRRYAGDGGLLVFIDQAEELITLGDPEEVAALDAGLAPILDNIPGLRLLATARGDFLTKLATLPRLGRDLSLYFLRPLPPERLRDVIVGPAETIGTSFETTAMIDELTAAAAQAGDGALPLLSFALADLWEVRDRTKNMILERAVAEMGGVASALSRHANEVIGEMLAPEAAQARSILLRLVTARGTRVRRSEPELAPSESARTALDALVDGRLVVVHNGETDTVYELAHECLLTGWAQLREWLDADAADRPTRERLAADAREWVRLGRPRNEALWQGTRLTEAAKLDRTNLADDDLAFLTASNRAARRRKVQRRLAGLVAIAVVVLAYATPRCIAYYDLRAAVAHEVDAALEVLHDARDHVRAANDVAAWAFAEFDHVSWDFAEMLWRGVLRSRAQADSGYATATGHLQAALAKDPTRDDLRDLLGEVLLERASLAERVHDHRLRDDLIKNVALYDNDHNRSKRWEAPADLTVRAPAGATITLELQGQAASPIGTGTGTARVRVPPGSHVVVVEMKGRFPVREPIFVERSMVGSHEIVLDITPPAINAVPKDFVYVPAGQFLFGEANETDRVLFFQTTPLRWRRTEPFLIGQYEVTFDEWFAYLATLPQQERDARTPKATKLSGDLGVTPYGAGQWRIALQPEQNLYAAEWDEPLTYRGRAYHVIENWRRFPVLGITAEDAVAYAEWLDSTGRLPGARLCSEVEWERAARGADGRAFPSSPAEGGRWPAPEDANLDFTHGKGTKGPDVVGSHPASMSPYGLLDTCGNAFEWTVAEDGGYMLRGGSYYHDRKSAHLADRASMPATGHDASIGFRLCATPPLPR